MLLTSITNKTLNMFSLHWVIDKHIIMNKVRCWFLHLLHFATKLFPYHAITVLKIKALPDGFLWYFELPQIL